ncbi:MAG: hypothetical protein A2Z91_04090 [Deltaproteobacteria bacterium GWA2_38_16]|nr:MAG: hypothetical protein A2Z91_04090 [Deltaproteobacteria bacterium GWA2_38_16]OGQ01812.1 MAG: hypothetical protein A3D19_08090 [Deltaproteobacteria bacterium RIFCSPHIGHO2_02_FULL_38_15]OGQ34796.1 MAG: hypothetical protein A3A72_00255 [Deltaproteobacteria bacterium RIFCSPLOWO2_01_FULL_38_9]OGQ59615.1 MAG: hypothetical protein A3G92_03920 [Deltaproteobacteria bacterium RIFCSPLOWO2_12_FULL_38_8]HBQ21377.1 Fis family transcriptional regulator [Deltaproteobacteria bacterium]
MVEKKAHILIVDDERTLCETMAEVLRDEGYQTEVAFDGPEAIEKIKNTKFDVIFCDLKMPKVDGFEVLSYVEKESSNTVFIVMTAYGSMETTLEAIKKGAHDYVIKPLIFDDILLKLKHLLEFKKLSVENRLLKGSVIEQFAFDNILGQGPEMKAVYSLIQKVAATQTTILITGEIGVGKEKLARAIHYRSSQKDHPFILIRCGSYSPDQLDQTLFGVEGVFSSPKEGTLFIDEIGELPKEIQLKFLQALQKGHSLRLIVSSSKDLMRNISEGTFREDLYYRINVIEVKVPPLRARKNDIPFLIKYFVRTISEELGKKVKYVTDRALESLMNYPWKGNIRELQNVLEKAILLADMSTQFLDIPHLPLEIVSMGNYASPFNFKEAMRQYETKHIQQVLEKNQFDKKKTATDLGLSLSSLYRKIEELSDGAN